MENSSSDPLRRAVHEAVTVGLGFGILGFQRFQVKRREWERSGRSSMQCSEEFSDRVSTMLSDMNSFVARFGRR